MTRIFISHSHANQQIAEYLVDFLLAALEIAEEDILCSSVQGHMLPFGTSIEEHLKKELNQTTGLIALITQESLRSTWVLFELGSSWAMGKLVIPILGSELTHENLPGPLKSYMGVSVDEENASYRLTDAINQLAKSLSIHQKNNSRKDAKKERFLQVLKEWRSPSLMTDPALQAEIQALKSQLQEKDQTHQTQLQQLEAQLSEQSIQAQSLQGQVAEKESQVTQLQEREQTYRTQLQQLEAQIVVKEELINQLSPKQIIAPSDKKFSFEFITVNAAGKETKRDRGEAEFLTSDLGDGVTLDMVAIPGGTFKMGAAEGEKGASSDEHPQHLVTISPFYLGKYPITQAQWSAIMESNPSNFKDNLKNPVECVSWHDARSFCEKLSVKTGIDYRLPSEAEWEYACRARTTTPFYFGETITGKLVNYDATNIYGSETKGEYRQATTPVGQFLPNGFGLYDMHGNVWEWCEDDWHDSYEGIPVTDGSSWNDNHSQNPKQPKLLRGGSWFNYPRICRSADRLRNEADGWYVDIGFRVVAVARAF